MENWAKDKTILRNGMDPRHGGGRENGGGLARGGLSLLLSFSGGEKESKGCMQNNYKMEHNKTSKNIYLENF